MDITKAFDTVDHSILLQKLNHYGIRGTINNWFFSYLLDRLQVTEVDSKQSVINKFLMALCWDAFYSYS